MSYICNCESCGCKIWMEDDFHPQDDRRCEECRNDGLIKKEEFVFDPDF